MACKIEIFRKFIVLKDIDLQNGIREDLLTEMFREKLSKAAKKRGWAIIAVGPIEFFCVYPRLQKGEDTAFIVSADVKVRK